MVSRSLIMTAAIAVLSLVSSLEAQMVTGRAMENFAGCFGLDSGKAAPEYSVLLVSMSAPGNILFPGEQAELALQFVNTGKRPFSGPAQIEIVRYGTRGIPGDIWKPRVFSLGVVDTATVALDLQPGGFTNVTVAPRVPETLGAYAIVADVPRLGRQFVSAFVRTFKAMPVNGPFTKLTIDLNDVAINTRLGVSPNRTGWGYKPADDPGFETWFQGQARDGHFEELKQAGMGITVEFGHGVPWTGRVQPMGVPRPWLDDNGVALKNDSKPDLVWSPLYDADFKKMVKRVVLEYGWPKGPVVAVKLWNEPWEGRSICCWGADMLRYREIFTALCEAVEEARQEAGVHVLVGGCDSSSNTLDKLLPDGRMDFINRLDFMSIHYQRLSPFSTYKPFLNRPGGRVRIWDTESWVANVDDRVATVVAANFSSGHDRAVGIYGGNIAVTERCRIRLPDGTSTQQLVRTTWSVAAAIGAVQHFIGERAFQRMLFLNGLPWVMVFDGLPDAQGRSNPDDGTLVIVGDLKEAFGADNTLFRTVSLRPGQTATLTLEATGQPFSLFDFCGNPVPADHGRIVVPLDHRGFYLRGDGSKGSFARLVQAVQTSRIEGYEPVEIVALDLLAPVDQHPALRLKVTNVLNRRIVGALRVALGNLTLQAPASVTLEGHESKMVEVPVITGQADPANAYALTATFDAGADGVKAWQEMLHVNVIARRAIRVDGTLDDWAGALSQTIAATGAGAPTLQETAWEPYRQFDHSVTSGLATAYLAYDEHAFYFAAKIALASPEPGMRRTDSPEYDDSAFYPATARIPREPLKQETLADLVWPDGMRRYSYRHTPDLPAGNYPNHDNVQIAFNVLADDDKDMLPNPPGTPYHYTGYRCSDYEYALNPVAPQYGGETEIYRLRKPGMPPKQHYPRQPKCPLDGAVKDGTLVFRQDGGTRIVECALPWSEIPGVKARLDAGQTIKFSYRVNNHAGGPCMELSRARSVAKRNGAFQVDWVEHWANEVEFAFEK